jgi:hypothetical protein
MDCGWRCQVDEAVALRLMLSKAYASTIPPAMKKIRIAQFGLGPIGIEALKLAATKPWAEIIGGIDIDPQMTGKDLGDMAQTKALRGKMVYHSLKELVAFRKPDLIFHTAKSSRWCEWG